jgi:hypothetical protein
MVASLVRIRLARIVPSNLSGCVRYDPRGGVRRVTEAPSGIRSVRSAFLCKRSSSGSLPSRLLRID